MNDILSNIKAKRIEMNFSQEYMADELGMTQAAYSNWEKGTRELTYNNLLRIADVLECSVIDIITYPKRYVEADTVGLKVEDRVFLTFEVSPRKKIVY